MSSLEGLRLNDPQCYAEHGYPHELSTDLRREFPVHFFELAGWPSFWAITKHADIVEISKQPEAPAYFIQKYDAWRSPDSRTSGTARATGASPPPPAQMLPKDQIVTPMADVELYGQALREGQGVLFLYVCANRDDRVRRARELGRLRHPPGPAPYPELRSRHPRAPRDPPGAPRGEGHARNDSRAHAGVRGGSGPRRAAALRVRPGLLVASDPVSAA